MVQRGVSDKVLLEGKVYGGRPCRFWCFQRYPRPHNQPPLVQKWHASHRGAGRVRWCCKVIKVMNFSSRTKKESCGKKLTWKTGIHWCQAHDWPLTTTLWSHACGSDSRLAQTVAKIRKGSDKTWKRAARLTSKRSSVDRLASSAILLGEISSLDHEALDDPVEGGVLVVQRDTGHFPKPSLPCAQSPEVLAGLGAVVDI